MLFVMLKLTIICINMQNRNSSKHFFFLLLLKTLTPLQIIGFYEFSFPF